VNGFLNEVNGGSLFPGPNVHAGDPDGTFSLSYKLSGPVFTDSKGNHFQTIKIDGTSTVTMPAAIPLNIQDGLLSTNYAELELSMTGLSGVVVDAANGSHAIVLLTTAKYDGQTGPSSTFDFTPFAMGGTGSYTLTNPSPSAGSLIDFINSGTPGSSYALLSNGFTETANIVPEPMSMTLLCTGLPLCYFVSRRRRLAV
jgi:hypothetical protein